MFKIKTTKSHWCHHIDRFSYFCQPRNLLLPARLPPLYYPLWCHRWDLFIWHSHLPSVDRCHRISAICRVSSHRHWRRGNSHMLPRAGVRSLRLRGTDVSITPGPASLCSEKPLLTVDPAYPSFRPTTTLGSSQTLSQLPLDLPCSLPLQPKTVYFERGG